MKKVIRMGVFETNSSAMHSIAIKRDKKKWLGDLAHDEYFDFQIDEDGVHHIPSDADRNYWREFRYLETFSEKLYYVIAVYCYEYDNDLMFRYFDEGGERPKPDASLKALVEVEDAVREIFPNLRKIEIPTVMETVYVNDCGRKFLPTELNETRDKTIWGAAVKPYETFKMWKFGNVYGACDNVVRDFLKDKKISLKDFLSDARYVIVLDDSSEVPQIINRVESGLLCLDDLKYQREQRRKDNRWAALDYLYPYRDHKKYWWDKQECVKITASQEKDSQTTEPTLLIMGLGNPRADLLDRRHNVGWMLIDFLAKELKASVWHTQGCGIVTEGVIEGRRVLLAKALTYMNNSGKCMAELADMYKLAAEDLLVAHDDMDIPFGSIRIKNKGSHGGHRGVKSIIEELQRDDFCRIKIGEGRPPEDMKPIDFVLSPFAEREKRELGKILGYAVLAIRSLVTDGVAAAMNNFNSRKIEA